MSKDVLVEIDLRTFDKSIDNCIQRLSVLEKDVDSEIGRLTYYAGNIIVKEAKLNHKFTSRTGTLVRSIHCAPGGASHSTDEAIAENSDLTDTKGKEAKVTNKEVTVQVGSWLDYAYPVETGQAKRGISAYPYLLPAFEKKFSDSVEYVVIGLRKILIAYGGA